MHGNLLNPPTSVSPQKSRFRAADRQPQAEPAQRVEHFQPAYEVRIASDADRREIARLRYDVYSTEIGQHPQNPQCELSDSLDDFNVMLVVLYRGSISGFVSLTPPSAPKFSIDKYFRRDELPFEPHSGLYEVRLLTVVRSLRGNETAALLLYSALRWVESHQGTQIVAIGRKEVLTTYLRIGMQQQGLRTQSGAVTYELLLGDVHRLRSTLAEFTGFLQRLSRMTHWALPFAFDTPASTEVPSSRPSERNSMGCTEPAASSTQMYSMHGIHQHPQYLRHFSSTCHGLSERLRQHAVAALLKRSPVLVEFNPAISFPAPVLQT